MSVCVGGLQVRLGVAACAEGAAPVWFDLMQVIARDLRVYS